MQALNPAVYEVFVEYARESLFIAVAPGRRDKT